MNQSKSLGILPTFLFDLSTHLSRSPDSFFFQHRLWPQPHRIATKIHSLVIEPWFHKVSILHLSAMSQKGLEKTKQKYAGIMLNDSIKWMAG